MEGILAWVYPLLTLLLGGGGVAGWYKFRQDAKKGTRETDIAEDVAISDQWRQIIEVQSKALLDPLTDRVATLQAEVTVLSDKVKTLEKAEREWKLERDELTYSHDLLWGWADQLVHHIEQGFGPPAPEQPTKLRRR